VETLSSREVYRNAWMSVREDEVRWPDGTPGIAAELREETGLSASRLEHLGRLHASYGFCSQGFDVYLATGLRAGPLDREATEQDMQHRLVSPQEFLELVRTGQVVDAPTLAACSLVQLSAG
jgi:8-oxo-dGTP pyrophosphatase MutT (NUDIX family)